MARVVVNGGARRLEAAPGRPLLFALMAEGLLVPSACGGRASCGQCRVRILSGSVPHNDKEAAILSAEDRASGIHLACQVPADRDLEIAIPESSLHALPYAARVASIRDIGPGLREVDLALLEPRQLAFKAGQYVQFLLPGAAGTDPVYRAYSIASPPSSTGLITLLFGLVDGGACSTYVFERLAVGDAVRVNGPFGEFVLDDDAAELLFVTGGTGMAPVRSMLLDLAERGDARPARLFCAARTRRELVYAEELAALAARRPGLQVIPGLTRPAPADRWTGETGGMPAVLARRAGDVSRAAAWLCGSPGLVEASAAALRSLGMAPGRIRIDKFS